MGARMAYGMTTVSRETPLMVASPGGAQACYTVPNWGSKAAWAAPNLVLYQRNPQAFHTVL